MSWDRLAGVVIYALEQAYDLRHEDAVARVRAVVDDTIDAFVHSRSRAGSLPQHLLVDIFSYLDFQSRIAAAHVSRAWRSLSLSNPAQLWSVVRSHRLNTTPGVLLDVLARSKNAPLDLDLDVKDNNALEVAIALTRHLHHTRRLSLWIDCRLSTHTARQLRIALQTSAPFLCDFLFFDTFSIFDSLDTEYAMRWFGDVAPALATAKLYCNVWNFRDSNAALASITRLMYSARSSNLDHELAELFPLLPALEALSIEISHRQTFLLEFSAPVRARLEALDSLALVASSEDVALRMSAVAPLATRYVCLSWTEAPTADEGPFADVADVLAHLDRIEHLTLHFSTGLNIDVRDARGRERTFLELPRAVQPGPAVFAQLASLAISELAWALLALPPAPRLHELTVFLLRPWSHARADGHAHASAFLASRGTLACPKLATLAFVARATTPQERCDRATVLDPFLVREFVRHRVAYDAAVLGELRFVGVGFAACGEHHVAELARLFAMARTVEIERHRPSDLRPISDILSWQWP